MFLQFCGLARLRKFCFNHIDAEFNSKESKLKRPPEICHEDDDFYVSCPTYPKTQLLVPLLRFSYFYYFYSESHLYQPN